MIGDRELSFEQYIEILKRRMWWIIIPVVMTPLLAYFGSQLIPNRYTSTTLVLVEQQKVPDNFVKPVVTEELNERLATMQEQILSRTRLQPLIERFGLFASDVGKVPMEDLVDRVRKLISVTAVSADFGTRTGGLPGFYVSFSARDPHLAQQVCSEILSMFMQENLRAREQTAEGTTEFLSNQLQEAKRKLDEQDSKLAAFKQRYINQLPGQEQMNLSVLGSLNTQLDAASQAVARAEQDETFDQAQLSQQLAAWKASRSGKDSDDLEKKLKDLEAQLSLLESKYTPDHPDVIRTKSQIAEVQQEIENAPMAPADDTAKTKSAQLEPVEIRALRAQIHDLQIVKTEKGKQQEELQKEIRSYQSRVQTSPLVEEQYKALTRDYQTALSFYNDLLAKKTQSAMATDLERKQQGEQFRVMDPPNLPEKPAWPNRPLIAFGGFGGGLALGFGLAFLTEMRDKTLRTDQDVTFYLQLPVLSQIPELRRHGNDRRRQSSPSREDEKSQPLGI